MRPTLGSMWIGLIEGTTTVPAVSQLAQDQEEIVKLYDRLVGSMLRGNGPSRTVNVLGRAIVLTDLAEGAVDNFRAHAQEGQVMEVDDFVGVARALCKWCEAEGLECFLDSLRSSNWYLLAMPKRS